MKEGALHREWSLWNQLHLFQKNSAKTCTNNDVEEDEKNCSINYSDYPEKIELDSPYIASNYPRENYSILLTFKKIAAFVFIFCFLNYVPYYAVRYYYPSNNNTHTSDHPCHPSSKNLEATSDLRNLQDYYIENNLVQTYSNDSEPIVHEVIDIPLFPYSDISAPAYSQLLLNHTFASSWNKPVLVKYNPPPSNITYDRIILTLDVNVQGVQYDRMIHIYLGNNEVWRSTTIEPAGQASHSFAQRDVSMYASLFNETTDLLVQLDNLVTPKLTGAFEVSISALYFKENGELLSPFGRNLTYPSIVPLTSSKYGNEFPPLVYYPDSKLSLSIPSVQLNTTKLLLLLSTSANGAEEFWHSNLLDEYKNLFVPHKHHFYGHGSCRVINVYVDDIRVHSANPKPYVFSGGVAPPLWNPIVSTGSFDLMPYHIDLTPVLPLLWSSDGKLDIEISNCIDEDPKSTVKSGIGSNWITSASLAVWEDETIETSVGDIHLMDNSTAIKSFAINPPFSGMLTQIIKASYYNSFETNVTHIYKDGSELQKLSSFENFANQTSFNIITKFGDTQSSISIPKSNSTVKIIDGNTLETIKDSTMLSKLGIASRLQFLPPPIDSPEDIEYNVNLSVTFDIGAYSGINTLFEIKSKENGTADFTIAATGSNHGFGSMLHNYTFSSYDGSIYNRVALADNATIVYDNITELQTEYEPESVLEVIDAYNNSDDFKSLILAISDFDWLTNEEVYELESTLTENEIHQLIDGLLDALYSI